MNKLIDGLPRSVEVNGIEYPVRTDFRVMLLIQELLEDNDLDDSLKIPRAASLFYKDKKPYIEEAFEPLVWFYLCGEAVPPDIGQANNDGPVFSFKHDADLLYAAFLSQYGVDLYDDKLHWWKFQAMFDGLTEEHKLSKVIGYRAVDLRSIKDKDRRKFYKDMKTLYRLPETESKRELSSNQIANAFL